MQVRSLFVLTNAFRMLSGSTNHSFQWQPITVGTSASHDPYPPITIDTNVPPPSGGVPQRTMTGVGT